MPEPVHTPKQVSADESGEMKWRELALQFDGHRIDALSHLKYAVRCIEEYATVRDILREPLQTLKAFLAAPPLHGEKVLAERLVALTRRSSAGVKGWIETEDDGVSEKLSVASAPPSHAGEDDEPVGEAGSMPGTEGFTMAAFNASDVPIRPSPTLEPSDAEVERAARAIYAVLPNTTQVRRPNTAGGWDALFEPDPWEEAPDRHQVCRDQARAALIASRQPKSGNQNGGEL